MSQIDVITTGGATVSGTVPVADGAGGYAWQTAASAAAGASRTITSATTITASDSIIAADATGAAFSQPLPAAFAGILTIDAITATTHLVTLTPAGSDTIEGASSLTLGDQASGAPYQSVQLARVGTTWRVV
jgi:hypothetical protein